MRKLQDIVKATIKAYGDDAPAHFGIAKGRLDGYLKRGKYPLALIDKILSEQQENAPMEMPEPQPEPQTQPYPQDLPPPVASAGTFYNSGFGVDPYPPRQPPPIEAEVAATAVRVEQIVKYIQGTVDVYLKQFNQRIGNLEKQFYAMRNAQLRMAGVPNLARPDQNAPVEQVFTTNPNAGLRGPIGNAFDTGIAPTKDMVDAQAGMTIIEGVPVPGGELARPADYIPDQPAFGYNWNVPRPRK
jgi:hypothetical protein